MFKRKKNKNSDNEIKKIVEEKSIVIYDRPKICLFDFSEKEVKEIIKSGYNISEASLGTQIELPVRNSSDRFLTCLPNHQIPENIHEFDIIIINLDTKNRVKYDQEINSKKDVKGNKAYYFSSQYPETVFDPIPFAINNLNKELTQMINKEAIVIVFSNSIYEVDYKVVEISPYGNKEKEKFSLENTVKVNRKIESFNKAGSNIILPNKQSNIHNVLKKYKDDFRYKTVYKHPYDYNSKKPLNDFYPLLYNSNEEIISYALIENKNISIVLPCIDNKSSLLTDLLSQVLPSLIPSLFPHSTENLWLQNEDYYLPNYKLLITEKENIQKEYSKKLDDIQIKMKKNKNEWIFLHDILTESGDNLVNAVELFLYWLKFEDIIDMDETKDENAIKEEDLQIPLRNGELLIIEIKGIGGTSKDSECSQISKIKFRRCKERDKFDVHALYIVNHQRYLPPLQRENPPFTKEQISDAENEERSLLTTWQLFKLFHAIENGIITKTEAREQFLRNGLIEFKPKGIKLLGKPTEYFKNNTVIILNINNSTIKVNDELLIETNKEEFYKAKILEMKLNNKVISECSNGEVGLKLDCKIAKKSKIWRRSID